MHLLYPVFTVQYCCASLLASQANGLEEEVRWSHTRPDCKFFHSELSSSLLLLDCLHCVLPSPSSVCVLLLSISPSLPPSSPFIALKCHAGHYHCNSGGKCRSYMADKAIFNYLDIKKHSTVDVGLKEMIKSFLFNYGSNI